MALAGNRYFRDTPLQDNLQPFQLPAKELAVALEMEQGRYDEGESYFDELKNLHQATLPVQRARANTIIQEFNKRVDDTVAKHSGDYAAANKELRKLKNDMTKLISPGGELHTMGLNLSTYNEWLKENRKNIGKKGGITAEQLTLAEQDAMNRLAAAPDVDPETGVFKQIELDNIASYVDFVGAGMEIAKDIEPTIMEKAGFEFSKDGKWILKGSIKTEELAVEKISDILTMKFMNDLEAISYLKQTLGYRGIDATQEDIYNIIRQEVQPVAEMYARDNILSHTSDISVQPYTMSVFEDAQARSRMRLQKKLDEESDNAWLANPQWQYGTVTSTGEGYDYTLSATGKVKSKNAGRTMFGFSGAPGFAGGLGFTRISNSLGSSDVKNVLSNPSSNEKLAREVRLVQEQLKAEGKDLTKMSDEDANSTFIKRYHENVNKRTTAAGVDLVFPPKVQENRTKQLIRSGFGLGEGRVAYAVVDPGETNPELLTPQKLLEKYDLTEEDFQNKSEVVSYSTPVMGYPNGDVIYNPKFKGKKIIMVGADGKVDRAFETPQKMTDIFLPDVDTVPGVDLSYIIPEGSAYHSYDEYGDVQPFTIVEDANAQIHIINADGVDISTAFGDKSLKFNDIIEGTTLMYLTGQGTTNSTNINEKTQ